jgi:hypothetical protein
MEHPAPEPAALPLYFAFGSNLDPEQMELRCPKHRVLCRAILHDHALAFHGENKAWGGAVAAADPRGGAVVHGVVYELRPGDFATLDRVEGYSGPGEPGNFCERVQLPVELENGETIDVFTYVLSAPAPPSLPSRSYRWALLKGMRHHGLPREAIAAVETMPVRD